jgi:hypothetical protein
MLVTIPEAFVYKSEQNIWLAEVWIAQELFELPSISIYVVSLIKLYLDEFQVLFEIVQILVPTVLEKNLIFSNF